MRRIDRFLRDEHGAVTIEFILWIPVIMALVAIVIDATTLYVTHSEMWNVARDTARRMVIGSVLSESQAINYAADAINLRDWPYCVDAEFDKDSNVAQVIIGIRVEDIAIVGAGSFLYQSLTLTGGDMWARVVMRVDPNVGEFFDDTDSGSDCL